MKNILKIFLSIFMVTSFTQLYTASAAVAPLDVFELADKGEFNTIQKLITDKPETVVQQEDGDFGKKFFINYLITKLNIQEFSKSNDLKDLLNAIAANQEAIRIINHTLDLSDATVNPFNSLESPLCQAIGIVNQKNDPYINNLIEETTPGFAHSGWQTSLYLKNQLIPQLIHAGMDIRKCSLSKKAEDEINQDEINKLIESMKKTAQAELKNTLPNNLTHQVPLISQYLYGQTPEQAAAEQKEIKELYKRYEKKPAQPVPTSQSASAIAGVKPLDEEENPDNPD